MKALLFSNAKSQGLEYLEWTLPFMEEFAPSGSRGLFIPFAGVGRDFEVYHHVVQEQLEKIGLSTLSLHHYGSINQILDKVDFILVGGGSTYQLLKTLQDRGDLEALANDVKNNDLPYMGWSAGCILFGPNIKTTNDMPIAWPKSPEGLNLLPFNINAHYTDKSITGHMGETRDVRLREYLILHPREKIFLLREGTALKRVGDSLSLVGNSGGHILTINDDLELHKQNIEANSDLSFLI